MAGTTVKPEVLAPAGGPDCLPAAVAGGADAVYLGLRHFNARGRAENFRRADLARHVGYLHDHGLKCYVVLNTLVHDDELPKALDLAWHAHVAGVDAAIIQDLGLWRVLRQQLPGLPLHASTQMTVHDPAQLRELAGLGAQRVILARELSLAEVHTCAAAASACGTEIEHFVHGALCYAFSGQCLISNFAGCRSANRGTCAQNCRFVYDGDTQLSLKDLALIDQVGALADAGVASLKIEGRLKGPDYVYTVARAYRTAVDAWAAGRTAVDARRTLKSVFARTLTDAPLRGDYGPGSRLHRADVSQDETADAVLLALDRRAGTARLQARHVEAGLGYRCTVGMFTDGFLVLAADRQGDGSWRCRIRITERGPHLPSGTPLVQNRDQAAQAEANRAMAEAPLPPEAANGVPVDLLVTGGIGQPLQVSARCADGRTARIASTQPLAAARSAPMTADSLRSSLGALGGSGFRLGRLETQVAEGAFLPGSLLKELRRQLVDLLNTTPVTGLVWEPPAVAEPLPRRTALWVAVGSRAAGRAALAAGAAEAWIDDDQPAVPGFRRRIAVTAPTPTLLDGPIAAGHIGALAVARAAGVDAIADVFVNVYSTQTIAAVADLGASAAVVSLELSGREIARLAARHPALPLAVIAHGRLPAMLTRQDHQLGGRIATITAAANEGGLPYQLERRAHDTVVWEGRRLCAPEPVARTAGLVDAWLLELGDLDADAVAEIVRAYARLRDGACAPDDVTAIATRHAPLGLFPGHLVRGARELDEISSLLG